MKWIWRTIGVIGMAVLASACHQNDTVFVVNTTIDTVDSNPGDGFCNDANGECSLRAAVMEANALPGVEEIRLVDGEAYELTIPGSDEDESATGDLDITAGVVIAGDAQLNGGAITGPSIQVIDAGGLVEFDGLDLNGGGGISITGAGSFVTIRNSDVRNVRQWVNLNGATLLVEGASVQSSGSEFVIEASTGRLEMMNVSAVVADPFLRVDDADVRIEQSTIGASAFVAGVEGSGSLSVGSSYVADCSISARITSLGYNIGSPFCGFDHPTDRDSDIVQVELDGLGDNGGPVLTFVYPSSSPLLDGGPASGCFPVDARDMPRPSGAACDIGATELDSSPDCSARGVGMNYRFCDFSSQNLDGQTMRDGDFFGANLDNASFVGADLSGSVIPRLGFAVDLRSANLRGASVADGTATVNGADLGLAVLDDIAVDNAEGASFAGAAIVDSRFDYAPRADFAGAEIRSSSILVPEDGSFVGAMLSGVYIGGGMGADYTDVRSLPGGTTSTIEGWIDRINVDGADLSNIAMRFLRSGGVTGTPLALPTDVALSRGYFVAQSSTIEGADLSGEDISGGSLEFSMGSGVNFTGTTMPSGMRFADLSFATLDGADMSGGLLQSASLFGSSMVAVDVSDAVLLSASLREATVIGTNFANADLRFADFGNAVLLWNLFDNTICPSGVNSDANGGDCDGQFAFGAPQPPGAPVPEEFQGREAEFATLGGS